MTLYPLTQAAKYLGVSEDTLRKLLGKRRKTLSFRDLVEANRLLAARGAFGERGEEALARVEWREGHPVRFRPAVGGKLAADWVVLDPTVGFGAPTVGGVRTEVLAWRYRSGEEVWLLAEDYALPLEAVEEALAFEGVKGFSPARTP